MGLGPQLPLPAITKRQSIGFCYLLLYGTGAAATAAVATYTGSVTPVPLLGGTFTASTIALAMLLEILSLEKPIGFITATMLIKHTVLPF